MVEGVYINSVFNVLLVFVYMIEVNKCYLVFFISLLKFVLIEGNVGIKLDDRVVNMDVFLDDLLFGFGNIKFFIDSFIFLEDWNNMIVQIEWNGMIFKGNFMFLDVKL